MSLSSFLKKYGHQCEFLDVGIERRVFREVKEIQPDIIAYSITTGMHRYYLQLNRLLKGSFEFLSIFGGPHATFFPEMIEEEGVDIVCRGEGEYPLLELADCLEEGRDMTGIKNLWVKENGGVFRNEVRPLIGNLDALPFVDRDLIYKYKKYRNRKGKLVLTGRGCPYNCAYCFNHSLKRMYAGKGQYVRKRSVQNVIDEIKELQKKCKVNRIRFIDDCFVLNKEWVIDFCRGYKSQVALPFICYTRVNLIDEELIRALKDAGCVTVLYAIETGNEYIRNSILRRNISTEQILNVARLIDKYELASYTQNMIGLPDESLEDAFETLRLNIRVKPTYAWVSLFQPYPGTAIYEYAKQRGYFSGTVDDIPPDYYSDSLMDIPNKKELENLQKLFSIGVAFPFLLPLIRKVIKLPGNPLFKIAWAVFRAYSYFFKVHWLDLEDIFIFD